MIKEKPCFAEETELARPIPESYWVISGKLLAGEYPCEPFLSGTKSLKLNALLNAGFDTFINLTGEKEGPDYTRLFQAQTGVNDNGRECLHFPISDYGLPTNELMTKILDAIDNALIRGRKVYLHCYGGIGRTGVTVGCFLVRFGQTGPQALNELARFWQSVPKSARHMQSPETEQQREFVLHWSE
jgi:protein tyrosine phosphatase (PTP) superfamily phosphohydrolase (DUF442 family)